MNFSTKNSIRGLASFLIPALFLSFLLSACTKQYDQAEVRTIRIAQQYGLAYTPVVLLQTEDILAEELAKYAQQEGIHIQIEWVQLGNATAIREAMLARELDFGFMGIPPFLIGLDKGTNWQLIHGLSECPLGLVSFDPNVNSLEDFTSTDHIAVPQPGSIQHILLAMAAEKQLGQHDIFDTQLVSMSHPDGLAALRSGSGIRAQFTSPPYVHMAQQEGAKQILSGEEAFGDRFTFIVGVASPFWGEKEHDDEILQVFLHALDKAIQQSNQLQSESPQETAIHMESWEKLAAYYQQEQSLIRDQLCKPGIFFESQIYGLDTFIDAMDRFGYISSERVRAHLSQQQK